MARRNSVKHLLHLAKELNQNCVYTFSVLIVCSSEGDKRHTFWK